MLRKRSGIATAVFAAACCVFSTAGAKADIVEGSHRTSVGATFDGVDYIVDTTPAFVTHLAPGATQAERDLMKAQFPGWNFVPATANAPGTLKIEEYDAVSTPQGLPADHGGVDFSVLYDDGRPTAVTTWNWIQVVTSVSEEVGYPYPQNPSVDPPRPPQGDDALPFYFTLAELGGYSPKIEGDSMWKGKVIPIQNPASGGDLRFFDEPQGRLTNAYMRNDFDLYLVSWEGQDSKDVTIYDGLKWGFQISEVPEPSSLVLLVGGIVCLVMRRIVRF